MSQKVTKSDRINKKYDIKHKTTQDDTKNETRREPRSQKETDLPRRAPPSCSQVGDLTPVCSSLSPKSLSFEASPPLFLIFPFFFSVACSPQLSPHNLFLLPKPPPSPLLVLFSIWNSLAQHGIAPGRGCCFCQPILLLSVILVLSGVGFTVVGPQMNTIDCSVDLC